MGRISIHEGSVTEWTESAPTFLVAIAMNSNSRALRKIKNDAGIKFPNLWG